MHRIRMKTAGVVVLMSLVLFCLFSDVATRDVKQIVDCSLFKTSGSFCTREASPICGTDGKTYGNQCAFCREVVKTEGKLAVRNIGKCR